MEVPVMDMKLNIKKIKTRRKLKAWTQQHLADVSGLNLRTIQRIESSGIGSAESAKAIAAALNEDVGDLLVESGQEGATPGFEEQLIRPSWSMEKVAIPLSSILILIGSLVFFQTNNAVGEASMYRFEGGIRIDENEIHEFGVDVGSNQVFTLNLDANYQLLLMGPENNESGRQTVVRLLRREGHLFDVLHKSVRPALSDSSHSVSYRVCAGKTIFYAPAVTRIPTCE
jgi:transcriptional regulator with XRE-family HTH domain